MLTNHLVYVGLCAMSGIGWTGIEFLILGEGRNQDVPVFVFVIVGAMSGLLVGLLMLPFYRAKSWIPTLLSAPLALWLGVFFNFALFGFYNYHTPAVILSSAAYACIVLFTPYAALMLVALVNGMLLRWILSRLPSKDKPASA